MGIEPSSYCPDVVEIANDKYSDRPKPSKSEPWMSESRCEVWSLAGVLERLGRTHLRILGRLQSKKNKVPKWAQDKLRRIKGPISLQRNARLNVAAGQQTLRVRNGAVVLVG